jgi:hypothetical protein
MKPQIIIDQGYAGFHNTNPKTKARMEKARSYENLSTICIIPTRGQITAKVVQSWMGMMTPMNQGFIRIFMIGMEVGEAYTAAIEQILDHPELSKWKYILTLEEDNMPPPDGLLKLYEGIKKYDVVGGLYWTKGEGGMPMIYGNPEVLPLNFIPQMPKDNCIQECNGLGMGFNLFKMEIFKDKKLQKPWFKTLQSYEPNVGTRAFTQDLYFYENAGKLGYRFACDTRIHVGHYDYEGKCGPADMVW